MSCLHDSHSEHILKMLKKVVVLVVLIIIIPLNTAAALTTTTEPKFVHSLNRDEEGGGLC